MRRVVPLGLLVFVLSCGGHHSNGGNGEFDAGEPCLTGIDLDGDGFGEGCPAGPDCDDADPTVHMTCMQTCNPDLPAPGCPCTPGTPDVSCFDGTPAQLMNPPCLKGQR